MNPSKVGVQGTKHIKTSTCIKGNGKKTQRITDVNFQLCPGVSIYTQM